MTSEDDGRQPTGAGYFDIETGLKRNNKGRLPGIAAGASDMIAQFKRGSLEGRRRRRRGDAVCCVSEPKNEEWIGEVVCRESAYLRRISSRYQGAVVGVQS
jgi:hypothetical protein